ncbi:hypothetical protein F5876DRAFT_84013 [Lentinula aff. lateritia]|uniref:Uncharacterized protein n=1 Tax=Lentinula aff. lateritia TaxID=2804960 RepID=A0ACC1TH20_9AGAR|nr:hypothetical protein F5876DRAFT_84013 [Lentinula aff. lateritia]
MSTTEQQIRFKEVQLRPKFPAGGNSAVIDRTLERQESEAAVRVLLDFSDRSYVDDQLRHSRRFDPAGIECDHPELFIPFPHCHTSSSASLASMSSASLSREDFTIKDEGQLRYWTSAMCNHSPHLFDFVITVRVML